MNWSRLFRFGSEGVMRRLPIAIHFVISGGISAMLIIVQPSIRPLIVAFNDGNLGLWSSILLLFAGMPLYVAFFAYLASTKAILDWLLDGK